MVPVSVITLLILCQGTAAIAPQAEGQASCSAPDCQEQNLRPSASDEHSLLNLVGKVRNHVLEAAAAVQCTVTYNAAIYGHNVEHLTGQTVASCTNACRAAAWGCKSFDWYKNDGKCDLSDMSADDVGGLKTDYAGNPYDHYNCNQAGMRLVKGSEPQDACTKIKRGGCSMGPEQAGYYDGSIVEIPTAATAEQCRAECCMNDLCTVWVFKSSDSTCELKGDSGDGSFHADSGHTTAQKKVPSMQQHGTGNIFTKAQAVDFCAAEVDSSGRSKHLCNAFEVRQGWSAFVAPGGSLNFYGWLYSGSGCIIDGTKSNDTSPHISCSYAESRTYRAFCCSDAGDHSTGAQYTDGPPVSNAGTDGCSSETYTLAEAKEKCSASTSCYVLHDVDCDGNGWRYCDTSISAINSCGSGHNTLTKADAGTLCNSKGLQLCSKGEMNAEWELWSQTINHHKHFYAWLSSGTGCIYHGPRTLGRSGNALSGYTWSTPHGSVPVIACGYPESRTYNALCCPIKADIIGATLPAPSAASLRHEISTSTTRSCLDLSILSDLTNFSQTQCYAELHTVCTSFSSLPSGTTAGDCLGAAVCMYGQRKANRDSGLCGVCKDWVDRCDYNDNAGKFVYNYAADTGRRRAAGFVDPDFNYDGRRRVSADWENVFPGKLLATTAKPCTVCGKMKCEDANEITCKTMGVAEKYCEWDASSRSCVTQSSSTYASLASTDETLVRKSGDC
jgi:hypothetical protein